MVHGILREVDTNGDGRIDYEGKSYELLEICVRAAFGTDAPSFSTRSSLTLSPVEFRTFIDHTESGLWQMFQRIDRNQNGEIDKNELRNAFAQSGVTVSSARLDQFFAEVDKNNDGVISYTEWRFVHLIRVCEFTTIFTACEHPGHELPAFTTKFNLLT